MKHPSHNTPRGFTVIESLMLVVVTVMVGIALNNFIVNFYRTNGYLLQQTAAVESARRGIRVSFENLRQAAYGEDGAYPLQSAATSSVSFYSDTDNDGTVEKIQLYVLGDSFYRTVTEATGSPLAYTGPTSTTTIAAYIRNSSTTPIFRFYDTDGAELSSPIDVSDVRSITTSLMVDLNPQRAPDIITLQETATLRNLR